jgi:hypothetical protein
VKIAELRDGETIESGGQPSQREFNRNQLWVVRLKKCGVFCQSDSAGSSEPSANLKKPAPSKKWQSTFVPSCAAAIYEDVLAEAA